MTNKLVVDPTWDLHMALVRPDLNNAEEVEATKEDTNGARAQGGSERREGGRGH